MLWQDVVVVGPEYPPTSWLWEPENWCTTCIASAVHPVVPCFQRATTLACAKDWYIAGINIASNHCITAALTHISLFRPHYELLEYCDSNDPMDLVFRGSESPGYYSSTPPQHHKGRPRKRKLPSEDSCNDLPVTMRMAAATLGKFWYKISYTVCRKKPKSIGSTDILLN